MSQQFSEHKAKQKAKDRDGWQCRFCGITNEQHKEEYGEGVHAHHIIKSSNGGKDTPRNLITVCRDCHNTLENTQARALERIERGKADEEVERLEGLLEKSVECIHGLERDSTEVEEIKRVIRGEYVHGHIVRAHFGGEYQLTPDEQKAIECYNEWGNHMSKTNLRIDEKDAEEIAEKVVERMR